MLEQPEATRKHVVYSGSCDDIPEHFRAVQLAPSRSARIDMGKGSNFHPFSSIMEPIPVWSVTSVKPLTPGAWQKPVSCTQKMTERSKEDLRIQWA